MKYLTCLTVTSHSRTHTYTDPHTHAGILSFCHSSGWSRDLNVNVRLSLAIFWVQVKAWSTSHLHPRTCSNLQVTYPVNFCIVSWNIAGHYSPVYSGWMCREAAGYKFDTRPIGSCRLFNQQWWIFDGVAAGKWWPTLFSLSKSMSTGRYSMSSNVELGILSIMKCPYIFQTTLNIRASIWKKKRL